MADEKRKIMVSVVCNAYNHGPYIKDALDGFVKQKTNFGYEVLIHDDASTDNTAAVIREYEEKYPGLIKPIYQKENQYQKGVDIMAVYHLPRLKGKFVALCEGDDYWTDPLKLQKQYDTMVKHPEVDICAHAVTQIHAVSHKKMCIIAPCSTEAVIPVEDVILGGGGFVATNSLLFRRELLDNPPQFRKKCLLDYSLQIQGAIRGGMLYLPDNMAVYRAFIPGSWTSRMGNLEFNKQQRKKVNDMLENLNCETGGKYKIYIEKAKDMSEFTSLELSWKYSEIRHGKLRWMYNEKPFLWKCKARIKEALLFLRRYVIK